MNEINSFNYTFNHNPSIHVYPSSIYTSNHPPTFLSILPPIYPSIHPPIHLSVHSSIHASIHPSTHPFIYPSTHEPTHVFIFSIQSSFCLISCFLNALFPFSPFLFALSLSLSIPPFLPINTYLNTGQTLLTQLTGDHS